MNNKRLNTQPFYGDALDRKELKAIVGGQSTNISPISIPDEGLSSCSTTCHPNSYNVLEIAITCKGPCRTVEYETVTCVNTNASKRCPKDGVSVQV